MSQSNSPFQVFEGLSIRQKAAGWDLMDCDKAPRQFQYPFFPRSSTKLAEPHTYSSDWADVVPSLILKLASDVAEKKKLEIRFNLLEILAKDLMARVNTLESRQTKIVPVNTFAPEPYELLKTFLVSVHSAEDEFEASWFDANIHTSGENEEEAVSNLKSLILDFYDSLSKETSEKLGTESKRQLAVLQAFITRTA